MQPNKPKGPSTGGSSRPFHSKRPSFGGKPSFGGHRRGGGFQGGARGLPAMPRHARQAGGFRSGVPRRNSAGNRGGRGGNFSQHIDVNRFVNKAIITEKVENFVPEHAFTDFLIDERLKKNIVTKGYQNPTPIQDKTIPHILRGSDLVGMANTGTGKTAAFLIPLIDKVLKNPKEKVLIVVPTRELALQIESEFRGFATHLGLFSVVCVGGASIVPQLRSLSRLTHFVIGTPGRLKDLVERRALDLSKFATVVLDEADRMLDMGFIHDMKHLMGKMPPVRHTLFFSATSNREVDGLINTFLKQPVRISVKTSDTAASVEQDIIRVAPGKDKFVVLCDLLRAPEFSKVIIFGRTKHGVERLAKQLVQAKIAAESIHGNKNQNQRVRALKLFTDHHVKVLCATDVAARGLDIAGVSHVINFDLPATYEDYVHRIGRTGRAGKRGKALTFV